MSAPAGWYPDPADPAARRWWDGTQWTAQTAPAPRFGEYAPTAGGPTTAAPAAPAVPVPLPSPVAQTAPVAGGYAAYPSAPAYAGSGATPPVVDVPTSTVWVWLAVAASVLPMLSIFLIDWNGYIAAVVAMSREASSGMTGMPTELMSWEARAIGISLIGWLFYAAFVVFSWLDWRELKRRGVVAPFGWAWSFFVLLGLGSAVYMIGRAVVLRRRTVAGGWAPLWTWIAATVIGFIASISLVVWVIGEIVQAVSFTVQGS
ncbi:Protein of unknown function DUF2510 [Microbacterium laevaniformans OR221]|uniref:DUF2510 domain-containing protein n=1 Tax=Microbacterium laevaniformans TaxID=36807 RepID=A0A150HGY8_9MICO|nr:DUF2510 domain-containing protein [Microbacterium laevaniformans]EIC07616.1 Protein of unknown function DUF2510 [Microbacterium laevaniformans OR221]KXZ61028.1 hypothetical protein Mlaev_00894 [Microbacterium laevaniformans]